MSRGNRVPITPEVLEWAIGDSGHEPAAVARAAGVGRATLDAWLDGSQRPSLTQLHKLASVLMRPEAVFFLPRPPEAHPIQVEFRYPPGAKRRAPSPREQQHIREAARLQRGLAWVVGELEQEAPTLLRLPTSHSVEAAATAARSDLGVPLETQVGWSSPFVAQRRWRAALEQRGVVVFFLPMGKGAARGFSLWHPRAPLIAVNTHWNAQARSYTMFHEYAHLLTRTSSMCAHAAHPKAWRHADRIERWCEQFAAAFLVPWSAVEHFLGSRFAWKRGDHVDDLRLASYVAGKLHVSLRATVLRLVDMGVAEWSLYQAIPPTSDTKQKGGPPTGGRRRPQIRVDEYGVRATRTFLEGIRRDAITQDDALRYLDVADSEVAELEALAPAS